MSGLSPKLRRAGDASLHHELHHDVKRLHGPSDTIGPPSTSLVPSTAGDGLIFVSDCQGPQLRVFFEPYFSPKDTYVWSDFRHVLRDHAGFHGPISFIRQGGCRGLSYLIGVDQSDSPSVPLLYRTHFQNMFLAETDSLSTDAEWLRRCGRDLRIGFYEFRAPSCFVGRVGIPPKGSPPPMAQVDRALCEVGEYGWACVETVFQADTGSFKSKLRTYLALTEGSTSLGIAGRVSGGTLGYDLDVLAGLRAKLADDDPMFFVAIRCLIICKTQQFDRISQAILAPIRRITIGDTFMTCITLDDYREALGDNLDPFDLILGGHVVAAGMPQTASELATFVHFPSQALITNPAVPLKRVWGIEYPSTDVPDGIYLGDNVLGPQRKRIIQNDDLRDLHMAIYGSTGQGKSTLLLSVAVQIMERGTWD